MIPAQLYLPIFLYLTILMTLIVTNKLRTQSYNEIQNNNGAIIASLFICTIFALFIGMRPIYGVVFGDTVNYVRVYQFMKLGALPNVNSGEWIWSIFMYYCAQIMDVSLFFTLVDILYFGLTLWACKRLIPNNILTALLFFLGALSFFSYGSNGIRNGLACSGVLLMLSYLTGNKKDKCIAAGIAFIVLAIHKSTMLPIAMSVISLLWIKSFKWAYIFWIISIGISLTFGNAVASIFEGLGFDDRMTSYLNSTDSLDKFSRTGFRWDFLIYSMMPIILGYYIIIKRGIQDNIYTFLINTYTLCNAFWVMVIRASFSNRFAYLSWFMYPLVLAYPVLKLDIWGNQQGKYASRVMLAQIGFTWFMQTIYW